MEGKGESLLCRFSVLLSRTAGFWSRGIIRLIASYIADMYVDTSRYRAKKDFFFYRCHVGQLDHQPTQRRAPACLVRWCHNTPRAIAFVQVLLRAVSYRLQGQV